MYKEVAVGLIVEEALKLDCLRNTKVLAGLGGLHKEVRFANVMEVPDISDWIHEHELLLTTAYPFQNMEGSLEEFMLSINEKKVSALGIKTRYIEKIPMEIIRLGNELNIPILELPPDAKFDLILRDVLSEITNRDYVTIKKSEEIHRLFTNIILTGGEIRGIAETLSKLTSSKVRILDKDNKLLEEAEYDGASDNLGFGEIESIIETKPIHINDVLGAHINMIKPREKFEEEDMIAMERAVEALAMIFLKRFASEAIEKKYKYDFLNDLIKGDVQTREAVLERGKFFGMDLSREYLLFLLDVDSFEEVFLQRLKKDERESHLLLSRLFEFVFRTFFSKAGDSIVWAQSDSIYVLYPISKDIQQDKKCIRKVATDLANQIKEIVGKNLKEFTFTIGLGNFYPDILQVSRSYYEAKEAIRLGKLIWGHDGVYHYDDLETYNILMQCSNEKNLKRFVSRKLGELIKHDRLNKSNLVETLKVYLEMDCNIKATADELFIHPKTVVYRRNQIEEILNVSLSDVEAKFSLFMALKIKDIHGFKSIDDE